VKNRHVTVQVASEVCQVKAKNMSLHFNAEMAGFRRELNSYTITESEWQHKGREGELCRFFGMRKILLADDF